MDNRMTESQANTYFQAELERRDKLPCDSNAQLSTDCQTNSTQQSNATYTVKEGRNAQMDRFYRKVPIIEVRAMKDDDEKEDDDYVVRAAISSDVVDDHDTHMDINTTLPNFVERGEPWRADNGFA